MKNSILLLALVLLSNTSFSQLKGSGKTVTKTFNYSNFDKINFEDLDGKFEVELGKPFSISVTIDDNLYPLLSVKNDSNNKELTISLNGNNNNKMYIEDTKIKIKVSLPNAVALKNNTNGLLTVSGISGNYLKIETLDNGSTELVGSIENLELKNTGNGVLNAKQLIVKNAIIKAFGNGNVYVNVSELITAKTSGNCTVINSGKAKFDASSSSSGNSRYVNN